MLLSTNTTLRSLYEHGTGEYNTFYGIKHPSYITFNLNPEPYFDCVFALMRCQPSRFVMGRVTDLIWVACFLR